MSVTIAFLKQLVDALYYTGAPGHINETDPNTMLTALLAHVKDKKMVQEVVAISSANVDINTLSDGSWVGGKYVFTDEIVLLASQTSPDENGIYIVGGVTAATRHDDFPTAVSCDDAFIVLKDCEEKDGQNVFTKVEVNSITNAFRLKGYENRRRLIHVPYIDGINIIDIDPPFSHTDYIWNGHAIENGVGPFTHFLPSVKAVDSFTADLTGFGNGEIIGELILKPQTNTGSGSGSSSSS